MTTLKPSERIFAILDSQNTCVKSRQVAAVIQILDELHDDLEKLKAQQCRCAHCVIDAV